MGEMADWCEDENMNELTDYIINEQSEKIRRLCEALEYYANEDIYVLRRDRSGYPTLAVESDKGKIARKALKELDDGLCEECGIHPADSPSKLCAGRDAYKDHQA